MTGKDKTEARARLRELLAAKTTGVAIGDRRYTVGMRSPRSSSATSREADGDLVIAQARAAFVASGPAVANEDVVDELDRDFGIGYRDVARLIQFADLVRARAGR
ncbi:MAG: hypothetical protein H0X22_07665 [Acidimicrobiia bacterium]|nr:hypothetical protein [Acidimicrobiia bacterium]